MDYFSPKEWLPKDVYNRLVKTGKILYAERYIDDRVLITANKLRDRFGVAYANTWWMAKNIKEVIGDHQYRGWRPMDCVEGAELSGHKFGQCLDLVFQNYLANVVRDYILSNRDEFPYIIEIEMNVAWLHYRVGIRGDKDIKEIYV